MPGWLKAILIIVGVCFVAAAAMVLVTIRYIRAHSGELMAEARAERDAGRRFGEGKPAEACIDAAMERVRQVDNLRANVRTRVFVDGCLNTANVSATFCAGVPNGIIDMAKWTVIECGKRGLTGNQGCSQVLSAWSSYCAHH